MPPRRPAVVAAAAAIKSYVTRAKARPPPAVPDEAEEAEEEEEEEDDTEEEDEDDGVVVEVESGDEEEGSDTGGEEPDEDEEPDDDAATETLVSCTWCGGRQHPVGHSTCSVCWPEFCDTHYPLAWSTDYDWWLLVGSGRHQVVWPYAMPFRTLWHWNAHVALNVANLPSGASDIYVYASRRSELHAITSLTPAKLDTMHDKICARLGKVVDRKHLRDALKRIAVLRYKDRVMKEECLSSAFPVTGIDTALANARHTERFIQDAVPCLPKPLCGLIQRYLWPPHAQRHFDEGTKLTDIDATTNTLTVQHKETLERLKREYDEAVAKLQHTRARVVASRTAVEAAFRDHQALDRAGAATREVRTAILSQYRAWYCGDSTAVPAAAASDARAAKRQKLA